MSDRAVGPSHQMVSCKLQFDAGFVKRAVSSWGEEVLKQDMLNASCVVGVLPFLYVLLSPTVLILGTIALKS